MKVSEVLELIEVASEPGKMTKPEALDYYELIIGELRARCEVLREEMDEEE